jgi:hypothetical protein
VTGGIGKNEDRLRLAEMDVHPLEIVRSYAGWIVSTSMPTGEFADLPPEHKALMGQVGSRVPSLLFEARNADGDVIRQTYTINRAQLAELIMELVGTFLDRDMFKQLVAVLPEDWSR